MGSGKSSAGKIMARRLNYTFRDIDQQIEEQEKLSVQEIFEQHGENYFRQCEKDLISNVLKGSRQVISTGGGAPCWFSNMELLHASSFTVYLSLPPEVLFSRVRVRTSSRPLLRGKTDTELLDYIRQTLEARESFYKRAHLIVDADCDSPTILAERIIRYLPFS